MIVLIEMGIVYTAAAGKQTFVKKTNVMQKASQINDEVKKLFGVAFNILVAKY